MSMKITKMTIDKEIRRIASKELHLTICYEEKPLFRKARKKEIKAFCEWYESTQEVMYLRDIDTGEELHYSMGFPFRDAVKRIVFRKMFKRDNGA